MSDIAVKALEWGPHPQFGDDLAVALIPQWGEQGHKYQVGRDADAPGYKAFLAPLYGSWFWTSAGHASLEDAKAAAQSDYEARVLSAIIIRSDK